LLTQAGSGEKYSVNCAAASWIVWAVDGLLRAMTFQLQPDSDQIALPNLRLTTSRDASGKKNASRQKLILQ
jgi:hypothetical protein